MYKEYIIKYKVRSIPFWYEFKGYFRNDDDATTAFLRENMIGLECFRIVARNEI